MEQQYRQKIHINLILKSAIGYWSKTLIYQVFYSLVYLLIFFLIAIYGMNYFGIMDDYMALVNKIKVSQNDYIQGIQELAKKSEFRNFSFLMMGTMVFLFPFNMGFFKIYRKIDLGKKYSLIDLFAGYNGINFFIYSSYYLLWIAVFSYAVQQTIFLALVWCFITLFSAPLMFFMNKTIFQSIYMNFKALKKYFVEIFVCTMLAILFKYLGMFTIIGWVFTFPFTNSMIYSLYRNIFDKEQGLKI